MQTFIVEHIFLWNGSYGSRVADYLMKRANIYLFSLGNDDQILTVNVLEKVRVVSWRHGEYSGNHRSRWMQM